MSEDPNAAAGLFFLPKDNGGFRVNYDAFVDAVIDRYNPICVDKLLYLYYPHMGIYRSDSAETKVLSQIVSIWNDAAPAASFDFHPSSRMVDELLKRVKNSCHVPLCDVNASESSVCVKNGVLDLETFELYDHSPDPIFTKRFDVDYNPDSSYDDFQAFLNFVVPEADKQLLLQEMAGFLLFPSYSIHKAFLLYGEGRNGKDTFLSLLQMIIGKDNYSAHDLLAMHKDTRLLYDLADSLANFSSEITKNLFNETSELFKKLTGQNAISCDRKYLSTIKFVNRAKLIFVAQEKPNTTDFSTGFWDRWVVIPFEQFIPPERRIPNFAQILFEKEASGIFNWMIEGYKRLKEKGLFTSNDKALDDWRSDVDQYGAFLTDVTLFDDDSFVSIKTLYEAYKFWAKDNGYRQVSISTFSRQMSRRMKARKTRYNSTRGYRLKIRDSWLDFLNNNSNIATKPGVELSLLKIDQEVNSLPLLNVNKSQRRLISYVMSLIDNFDGNAFLVRDLYSVANDYEIGDVEKTVNLLLADGYLLEPKPGYLQKV